MPRLRRVDCAGPGIGRRRRGKGFSYVDEHGRPVQDQEALDRVRSLAIPPAWEDVWISPHANGHLQAVGTDAAGRRQYLYHPVWREHRDRQKFDEMLRFARALPPARRRWRRTLGGKGLSRDRVLAFAVALLDRGLFRIGSEEYANNGSHGLATLRRRHVTLNGNDRLAFDYEGKSGQHQELEVRDRALRRVAAELLGVRSRGGRFLVYPNDRGWHEVHADEVNAFLKQLVGDEFSAKDFRTWHATVLAAVSVATAEPPRSVTARRRVVSTAIRDVAAALGNTPAVCRASYVDPRVFDRFRAGHTIDPSLVGRATSDASRELVEAAVRDLLDGQPG